MIGFKGHRGRLPVLLQTDASEAGLLCVMMVATYYGLQVAPQLHALHREAEELPPLHNRRAPESAEIQISLHDLMRATSQANMTSRPLHWEPADLVHLQLPCILQWNSNHFVVLARVGMRT